MEVVLQQTWLHLAYQALRRDLVRRAPENVVVSYGFPKSKGGKAAIGQCWYQPIPDNEATKAVIFVHPCQWTKPVEVLHVLVHEMVHAATPGTGHKGLFIDYCRQVGLEGPWTATHPGEELTAKLVELADSLPPFPSAAFDPTKLPKKAGTRLRLWECACLPKPVKLRAGSDTISVRCNDCDTDFELKGAKE